MNTPSASGRFAALTLPHLDAAYNLARWLLHSDTDAADVVQEAYLRALRGFAGFGSQGRDAVRPWLLAIVRNACWTHLERERSHRADLSYDEDLHGRMDVDADPQTILLRAQDRARLDAALRALPAQFREVLVLRELQDMPYAEIAQVLGLPAGTVMSRLSRGRARLARLLQDQETRS